MSPRNATGAKTSGNSRISSSPPWKASQRDCCSSITLISITPTCGIFLPRIAATIALSPGSSPGREIPHEFAKRRVCFQRYLRRRYPRFQDVRPGADRMRLHVAGVRFGDLVRNCTEWGQRHDVGECVVAVLEMDAQRMAIDCLESLDSCAVVELRIGLGRRRSSLVETDDFPGDVEGVRRPIRRIDETLDRIDVVVSRQFAPLPLERGIVGKYDSRLDSERVRLAVVGDLRQCHGRERNDFDRTRKIVEGEQRLHDRGDHRGRIDFARHRRVEAGFGARQCNAQDLGGVRSAGQATGEQDDTVPAIGWLRARCDDTSWTRPLEKDALALRFSFFRLKIRQNGLL